MMKEDYLPTVNQGVGNPNFRLVFGLLQLDMEPPIWIISPFGSQGLVSNRKLPTQKIVFFWELIRPNHHPHWLNTVKNH